MKGHCSDEQNGLNRLTISDIINQIVEHTFIGIRTKHENIILVCCLINKFNLNILGGPTL